MSSPFYFQKRFLKLFCFCLGTLPLKEKTWKRQMLTQINSLILHMSCKRRLASSYFGQPATFLPIQGIMVIQIFDLINVHFNVNQLTFNRYMNGAASNPDAHAFAHAAAQVKKGLEIAKKLGAENFGKSNEPCLTVKFIKKYSSTLCIHC